VTEWEYLAYLWMKDRVRMNGVLQELGQDGWELITIYDGVAFFKQPKEDNEQVKEEIQDTKETAQWQGQETEEDIAKPQDIFCPHCGSTISSRGPS